MPWSKVVRFDDPLVCEAALQSTAEAEVLPMAKGTFNVEATQIGLDTLRLQRFHVALPQIGTFTVASDRRSIGFLVEENKSDMTHCGLRVTPEDILVHSHDPVHQRSGADFRYATMSLPMDRTAILCRAIVGHDFLEDVPGAIVRPSADLMSRLKILHKVVGQLSHDTSELLELPAVRRSLEEQLAHVMVRCLAEGVGVKTTIGNSRHDLIIAKFEDFLAAHPDQPLYLTEICAELHVAERTLRAACEEHLGMGPIRFLSLRRMRLVRRALLAADAKTTSVTHVVTNLGFWELGRFSVAYRAMFGESPSETLRRSPDRGNISINRPKSLGMDLNSFSTN